ncbi:MAG: NusA-like transcription termination signal-binding factor [Candidatus Aenigmarchaeota archaeon]|nr:NusA-like transcription termination signal-binding factor [Candidatus Aenigmarchaeota archaeon]
MKLTLDQNTLQSMNLFQSLTGAPVVDCITEDDEIYFVIGEGKYGLTVGKNGAKIKHAERVFKKNIKVFEYAPTLEEFVKKVIPDVQEIKINGSIVYVKVKPSERARTIGKAGKNIKIINKFLQRLFSIEELKVK